MIRTNHLSVSLPEDWVFAYTADDERLASYALTGESASQFRWTLRNLSGKVVREFRGGSATADVYVDYAYRGEQLVAAEVRNPQGNYTTHHFTLDHLGTPRLVTNDAAVRLSLHEYFPYGEEATTSTGTFPLRFTGHERDFFATGGATPNQDDLDYMHARFHSPLTGRFMSFDPIGGNPRTPQSWNRYAYVLGNPLKYIDPFGLKECEIPNCTVVGTPTPIELPPTGFAIEFATFLAEVDAYQRSSRETVASGSRTRDAADQLLSGVLPVLGAIAQTLESLTRPQGDCGVIQDYIICPEDVNVAIMTINPNLMGHIFKRTPGHVAPLMATSRSRMLRLFDAVRSNPLNRRPDYPLHLARREAGVEYFTQNFRNGQVWVEMRRGSLVDAGVNRVGAFR